MSGQGYLLGVFPHASVQHSVYLWKPLFVHPPSDGSDNSNFVGICFCSICLQFCICGKLPVWILLYTSFYWLILELTTFPREREQERSFVMKLARSLVVCYLIACWSSLYLFIRKLNKPCHVCLLDWAMFRIPVRIKVVPPSVPTV